MPPKVKVTREDIIKTALDIVRKSGAEAINARSIASALGCSTQPIFSNFATMDDLRKATIKEVEKIYNSFMDKEIEKAIYPVYKAGGMAYIRFAKEERELFKLLFMRDRKGESKDVRSPDFDAAIEIISAANGISREAAGLFHLEMWICVHGIGVMLATSFFDIEWESISEMISDVYRGLCERFKTKLGGGE